MQSNDAVRQWTAGVAYQGLAIGIGQINVGVQKTDYRKAVETPDGPLPESRDQPWLFSAAAAIDLHARLAIYGGFTRGLEESDVAPESAVNRDTAPPAIGTRQVDAGLRWHASGKMTVIAGVFEVSKPYFGLDDLSLFRRLGDVRHRGIEASIRGTPVNGLSIVAGGVFLDASLSGEDVSSGEVGPAPAGTPSRKLAASIDWHPPGFQRLSFDLSAEHIGRQYADVRNAVVVPGRTTVDIGARYRFHLDDAPAVLRVQVTNLSDAYGWDIVGSNVFTYIKPRILSARLTVDF
jgi:iron complex outermembrane receptor protein